MMTAWAALQIRPGLFRDRDGVIFTYPETGYADQKSAELQLFGDFGGWDFVAGLYRFEEQGGNLPGSQLFPRRSGNFHQLPGNRQYRDICQCRLPGDRYS